MDAGGIVLVLRPLPGASEFNHIWFLLAWKHSILCKVSFYHRDLFTAMSVCTSLRVDWQHLTSFGLEKED